MTRTDTELGQRLNPQMPFVPLRRPSSSGLAPNLVRQWSPSIAKASTADKIKNRQHPAFNRAQDQF
jgi:hypothetical protein